MHYKLLSLTRLIFTIIVLILIGFGIYDYIQNIDENDCSMTYMRPPIYVPIKLNDKKLDKNYSNYKLYHQCEKYECDLDEKVEFKRAGNIPVLFITGNADSHKQVRSIAALSLSKTEQAKYINENINFNFFTISFNEELSALYGPVLVKQTNYVQLCVKRILSLYKSIKPETKQPKKVIIVGNSMGGIIARGIFVLNTDQFNASEYVDTIITQASPHRHAIVNNDHIMNDYYSKINSFWFDKSTNGLDNMLLVSLYGGNRDILVRNNLAQFDNNTNTNAKIISKLSTTIPYVWRSVDHRCMAWCKELILVLNRILFKLIDKESRQIVEDRNQRERVFNYFLSNDNFDLVSSKKLDSFKQNNLKFITKFDDIHLSFNDFNNKQEIVYIFELNKLSNDFNANNLNSLFIYTNLPKLNTFLMCNELELNEPKSEYKCLDAYDLYSEYGQSIPPNELGRDIGIKALNIENFADLAKIRSYFIVRVPIWRKSDKNFYRAILKLDWYDKSKRVEVLNVPKLFSSQHSLNFEFDTNNRVSFKRYYFNDFSNLVQAFKLDYLENDCQKQLDNRKTKLLSTNIQIKFNEMNDVFYYSQITNLKYKNLTLKLSKNSQQMPFIDVYIFDLEHLISDSTSVKCSNRYLFNINISYLSILGQLVRFYSLLLPAFLVVLLQFMDFLILNTPNLTSNLFILNCYLTKFKSFLIHSSFLMVFMLVGIKFVDSDFKYLESINEIFSIGLIFTLYLCAYVLVSLTTGLFSFIFFIFRKLFSRIFSFIYGLLNKFYLLSIINCVVIIASGLYLPILSHIYLFYAELVSLIATKKEKLSNQNFTRILLIYMLILVKIPALLVWIKDINNIDFDHLNGFISAVYENNFLDLDLVLFNFIVYLLNWFKIFKIKNYNYLFSALIVLNSCLTLLFASLNLFRLPYFLLIHLFLMSFYSGDEIDGEKKKAKSD